MLSAISGASFFHLCLGLLREHLKCCLALLPISTKTLAYSSESSKGWARWPRTWKTWWMRTGWGNEICFAFTREVSRESLLLSATTWMDGARPFPEVCSHRMWGNGHKLEHGNRPLDIGKNWFYHEVFQVLVALKFMACPSSEVSETWTDTAVCKLL